MRGVAAGPECANDVQVVGVEAGVGTGPSARPGGIEASLGALGEQRPLSEATASSTCCDHIPCNVVVSIKSRRLRKCIPLPSSYVPTASGSVMERARKSSRTATSVSPERVSRYSRTSTGRLRFMPEACSTNAILCADEC